MKLRQLEFLIAIAELGSITACAEHFAVSQPSVTQQIHQLEEELSSELLIRSPKGTSLTETGEKIVSQAKKVFKEFKRIPLIVAETRQFITGWISLGVSPLLPTFHFSRIYSQFHKDFPGIRIKMVEVEDLHLLEQVKNSQVDLAMTPIPLFSTSAPYEMLWSEELVVVSNPDDNLEDIVTLDSLQHRSFVFMTPGCSLNLIVTRLFQKAGFEPRVVAEASGIRTLAGLIESGVGIAVVPKDALSLEAKTGLVRVSRLLPETHRNVAMVFKEREQISPAVQVFMDYIRTYAQKVQGAFIDKMQMQQTAHLVIE